MMSNSLDDEPAKPSSQLFLADLDARPTRIFARRMAEETREEDSEVVGGRKQCRQRTNSSYNTRCQAGACSVADDCATDPGDWSAWGPC